MRNTKYQIRLTALLVRKVFLKQIILIPPLKYSVRRDATGKKLKEQKVDGNVSISIDIKDIPAGIYTLVLKNQLKTEQQRFIKQ